ncbi:MAG: SpoIIE family protein phosphatase [Planctomycetota bacterium]
MNTTTLPTPPTAQPLALTDFIDAETLQEIQDSFASFARLQTLITDPAGQAITTPTDVRARAASDSLLGHLVETEQDPQGKIHAPITVAGQVLGEIVVRPNQIAPDEGLPDTERDQLHELCGRLGLDPAETQELLVAAENAYSAKVGASVQFLNLTANSIAQLCYEQYQNRQRLRELRVLYEMSTLLSAQSELQHILDTAATAIAKVMDVKAVVIRLLRNQRSSQPELEARAVFGIDRHFADKGKTLVNKSELTRKALRGEMVYIEDMTTDPRSFYPHESRRAGITSMLSTGLISQDQGIGTIQLFTAQPRRFSGFEESLVRAIAQLLATAIRHTKLDAERRRSRALTRQVTLARGVQQRMLPKRPPHIEGIDISATYVPSQELGGDFYDFINLGGSTGIAVGDAVGKGVAASLLMAGVRASLRAYAHDLYDLDVVVSRVNSALYRDTLDNEFATLWYGTIDHASRRLTYCNAGHEPALLLRGDRIIPLDAGGMVVGVLEDATFTKGVIDLKPGDTVLLYSDGLTDAMDPDDDRFGRERVDAVLEEIATLPAEAGIDRVLLRVDKHRIARRANDDTTVVVIRVTG